MAESGLVEGASDHWAATGVGAMPGTDPGQAAAMVAGELPQWPHLCELPARGPGADMVGRAMHLLCEVSSDFAVQTSADGWRRAAAPGREMRRAAAYFAADCDAAAERLVGYQGPFTVPIAGPWTLAAAVSDERGERCLRDRGYVRELGHAHAEAVGLLVGRLRRNVPGARLVVMLDEPSLAAVHDGEVPFSSGYRRHRAVPADEIVALLRPVQEAARSTGAATGLHSCAPMVWPVAKGLRPDWLSLDAVLLQPADTEDFGAWLESGAGTVWGVWPTSGGGSIDEAHRRVAGWLRRLGYAPSRLPAAMGVSPRCGLAGATTAEALLAMRGVTAVARRLAESE